MLSVAATNVEVFVKPQEGKPSCRQTFNDVAPGYDRQPLRFFSGSSSLLVDLLNLKGSERLLDVATGTGAVAIEAARKLCDGFVSGIDFSQAMLAQATTKAAQAGLRNIEFRQMDMMDLRVADGSYDVATCAFGIFFADDMQRQLVQIARTVKRGGVVAITGFHNEVFRPMIDKFFQRLLHYGIERPTSSWRRIGTRESLAALCREAGLVQVNVHQKNVGYFLRDADEWWDVIWWSGYRGLLARLVDGDIDRFKREHLADIRTLSTDQGLWLDVPVLFAIATRP